MTTLSPDNLIAAGYRQYDVSRPLSNADFMFQKRLRDGKGGTLYFINIYQYGHPNGSIGWQHGRDTSPNGGMENSMYVG